MNTKKLMAVLVAGGTLCLPSAVNAISLVYLEGPNVGQTYAGPVTIKMFNYDTGSLYPTYAMGSSYGYSGSPTNVGYQAGVSALDSQVVLQAANASLIPGGYGDTLEDSWGIARVTGIYTPDNYAVWTPLAANKEITAMFWGEQDFYLRQSALDVQTMNGVGMHVDFYEDAALNYTPTNGTLWKTGLAAYATATDGTRILRTASVAGFLHGAGAEGGLAAEFESLFNTTALTGTGAAYVSLYDASTRDYSQFNSDMYTGLTGLTADIKLEFTTSATSVSDWLVTSQDPLTATAVIPEPVEATLLVMGGALLMLRRRLQNMQGRSSC